MGAHAEAALSSGSPLGCPPQGSRSADDGLLLDGGDLPPRYDLHRVALSHAHVGFAPTAYEPAHRRLHTAVTPAGSRAVAVSLTQVLAPAGARLSVRVQPPELTPAARAALVAQLRWVVAADDPLAGLREAAVTVREALPVVARQVEAGGGRVLRSPTVWEDLVKLLLATGRSWRAAQAGVSRLVAAHGEPAGPGVQVFPGPAALAALDTDELVRTAGAGYRAAPLVALARRVDSGQLDLESWRSPEGPGGSRSGRPRLPDEEVREAVQALPGFGPWAAAELLGLLGRPRALATDRWARETLARLLHREVTPGPAEVAARYAPLGRWAGTGQWLELTAGWFRDPPAAGAAA